METKFLEFVADVMEVESDELSMNTEYKVYEPWDSLMMMTLIMEVEDEYEVSIPLEMVGKIKTLKDLFDLTA